MTFATASPIQLAFGIICALTGIFGTWLQVAGQRFTHRGGPRESPVLAVLGGMGSPWDQEIFINDRGSVAAFGAMLGNAGSAMLMASVVAGLVINFPGIWPAGAALYLLVLLFGAGRIFWLGMDDLWHTRIIQEDMFAKLPADGIDENLMPGKQPLPGHVVHLTSYRRDILMAKPDLARSIMRGWPIVRRFKLFGYVRAALRREESARRAEFAAGLKAATTKHLDE